MSIFDKLKDAGSGITGTVADLAENVPTAEEIESAARTATIRRLTGFGMLWDKDEDGNFRPLTMGYIAAAAAVGLYLVMGRK